MRIVAVNAVATDAGVAPGTRLADMRALCPALVSVVHDPGADRALLESMALWAQRWGPWSVIDGLDYIIL